MSVDEAFDHVKLRDVSACHAIIGKVNPEDNNKYMVGEPLWYS